VQYAKLVHDGEFLLGAIVMGISGVGFRLEKILKKTEVNQGDDSRIVERQLGGAAKEINQNSTLLLDLQKSY